MYTTQSSVASPQIYVQAAQSRTENAAIALWLYVAVVLSVKMTDYIGGIHNY